VNFQKALIRLIVLIRRIVIHVNGIARQMSFVHGILPAEPDGFASSCALPTRSLTSCSHGTRTMGHHGP
jgi:hypothetical protein